MHPKMQYTYVGVDSHKDTHTAVFLDCFFEKLGEIKFDNLPSKFDAFLKDALELQQENTTLLFGLEDVSSYGRNLTIFLKRKNQQIKHVNALFVAKERKNQTVTQKTDSVDAECAARVLLSKFGELPDAMPEDKYWILRTLVVRRDFIVKNNISLKNHLHSFLVQHYPNYHSFFGHIDCNTSLAFFMRYPSPQTLQGVSLEELERFLHVLSNGRSTAKARLILDTLQDTAAEFQEVRDMTVQSTIRQLQFNMAEIEQLDEKLEQFLAQFDCTLTSIRGVETVSAAQLLSCIGDVKRFSTPAKLARYAGIAPVTYASGKKDLQFANQRGNRELNRYFYKLAIRISSPAGPSKKVINSFFYDYYHSKIAEGKTKRQAIKCVERRLVNIVWGMLTKGREYINPETYDLPKPEENGTIQPRKAGAEG